MENVILSLVILSVDVIKEMKEVTIYSLKAQLLETLLQFIQL